MQFLKRTLTVTWRIMVFFVMWAALTALFIVPAIKKYTPRGEVTPLPLRLYIEIASMVTILFSAWVAVRFIDRRPFVSLGFARHNLVRDCLIGLAIGLGMMTSCVALLYVLSWVTWNAATALSASALTLAI